MPDDADSCAQLTGQDITRATRIRIPSLLPTIARLLYAPLLRFGRRAVKPIRAHGQRSSVRNAPSRDYARKIVLWAFARGLQSQTVSLSKTRAGGPARKEEWRPCLLHATRT